MLFADIIIDISVKSLDRPFQYRVPDPLQADAVIGALVDIPFGKGNRTVQGYIIGLSDQAKFDIRRTKDIIAVGKAGRRSTVAPAFPCLLDKNTLRRYDE